MECYTSPFAKIAGHPGSATVVGSSFHVITLISICLHGSTRQAGETMILYVWWESVQLPYESIMSLVVSEIKWTHLSPRQRPFIMCLFAVGVARLQKKHKAPWWVSGLITRPNPLNSWLCLSGIIWKLSYTGYIIGKKRKNGLTGKQCNELRHHQCAM